MAVYSDGKGIPDASAIIDAVGGDRLANAGANMASAGGGIAERSANSPVLAVQGFP